MVSTGILHIAQQGKKKGGAGPPVIFVSFYKVVQPPLLQLVYNPINYRYAYHKSWSLEF